jgi:hypothetical protein
MKLIVCAQRRAPKREQHDVIVPFVAIRKLRRDLLHQHGQFLLRSRLADARFETCFEQEPVCLALRAQIRSGQHILLHRDRDPDIGT